jgi:hypothetical protein
MRSNSPTAKRLSLSSRRARLFLILAAALLQVSLTATIFIIGRAGALPGQFDPKGLGNFASDGFMYQSEVLELCGVLRNQGVIAWANWPSQLHVRLYSLPVAAFNGCRNFNILTIEPLNLIYYLIILVLVFKIAEIVFGYRSGLMAAATVALWPSFLLHTTQLLRDPLLVAAFLLLILSIILCLKRDYAWWKGILVGLSATAGIVLIRIVRMPMWNLLWAITVTAILLLLVRLVRQRRFPAGNVAFAIIMIAGMTITPRFQNAFHSQQFVKRPRLMVPEEVQKLAVDDQIAVRRQAFEWELDSAGGPVPSQAGSDIDRGIRFRGPGDILRHVPRAMVVGFFSPFPNMWFASGKQVGSGGRLLSGFETLLSYMVECLALVGLWRKRKHVSAWFLFLVTTFGAVALGLVVGNIGALFRLRYPFWILLIVCGAGGADYLFWRRSKALSANHGLTLEESAGTIHS